MAKSLKHMENHAVALNVRLRPSASYFCSALTLVKSSQPLSLFSGIEKPTRSPHKLYSLIISRSLKIRCPSKLNKP